MKLCLIDSYLYFDEDQRSFIVVVGFWKILGVYFCYTGDFLFWA